MPSHENKLTSKKNKLSCRAFKPSGGERTETTNKRTNAFILSLLSTLPIKQGKYK